MSLRVFIDGAEGTTGLEIRDRLAGRDSFALVVLDDAHRKDLSARKAALNESDVAILCLPDEAAREAVALIENTTTRVIDASSAHRVADGWTYGFPELIGAQEIAQAMRVSNPGCYPTGFLALLAPLVRAGLLPADWPYSINAVSGYSGGGKALIGRFAQEPTLAFRAYGLDLSHKHLPEMQKHAGLDHAPIFSPAVVPAYRGMVVDIPLPLAAMDGTGTPAQLRDALAAFYRDAPLVRVSGDHSPELILHEGAVGHDGLVLSIAANAAGTQARLVAQLDNLGKGASGAAVQSLNLMAGLAGQTGLRPPPAEGA